MNPKTIKRASRKLSLVLRHQPEAIGLALDENGWAGVEDLLRCLAATGTPLRREELEVIVAENDKRRFSFSPDGQRIRASQGHSIAVDLQLAPVPPPAILYHGTSTKSIAAIMRTGLHPQKRRHVHLSLDRDTATTVGRRHGKPIILQVDSAAMARDGFQFYCSANGVWLTEAVPQKYLSLS